MPVFETSRPETNGMMVAKRSHHDHMEYIRNGTWDRHQASTSGHVKFMRFWRYLGGTSEILAPTLQLGDVLVFSKVVSFTRNFFSESLFQCTVHSASGDNSGRRPRQAWQIRFVTDPQSAEKAIKKQYPGKRHASSWIGPSVSRLSPNVALIEQYIVFQGMGDSWSGDTWVTGNVSGAKYPRLWPSTIPEEDQVRAEGHMVLGPGAWLELFMRKPSHLVITTFTRAADNLGLFWVDHPVFKVIVYLAETLHIL